MDLISTDKFFAWTNTVGIAPDGRYSPPQCLAYVPHRPHHRFWAVPSRAAELPFFVSHLLAGLDPWSACLVWPRGGVDPQMDAPLVGELQASEREWQIAWAPQF